MSCIICDKTNSKYPICSAKILIDSVRLIFDVQVNLIDC